MKHGDFTDLAKYYVDRPGYSLTILEYVLSNLMLKGKKCNNDEKIIVADVGAGTGKLTEALEEIGLTGYAVEPNDAMRMKGIELFEARHTYEWRKGSAEDTGLPDNSVDWVLMGSSFHWTDAPRAITEFYRILKPGGYFTAIWNPRDIQRSALHMQIEKMIYSSLPNMKRVSSGAAITTESMQDKMLSGGLFADLIFMEAMHEEVMSVERYMNIWRSVNDIQVQAGEEGFKKILNNIQNILEGQTEVVVPYKSRAWTVRSCKEKY